MYADAPANLTVQVLPFIEDMAKAYSEADLIICRAGALTVTEVATAGVAAVLYRFLLRWMTTKLQMPNFWPMSVLQKFASNRL